MLRPSTVTSCVMCILTLATVAAAIEEAPLPAVWQVKLDPGDSGLEERWNAADLDDSDWTALRTDGWEGWENQGLKAEADLGWYRVRYEVPEALEIKRYVYLYFNCVDEQAWVWVNGRRVGEHTLVSEGLVGSRERETRRHVGRSLRPGDPGAPARGGTRRLCGAGAAGRGCRGRRLETGVPVWQ